jgi:hypothetical protein
MQPLLHKFVTVPLPKRFRGGRFTSETATWGREQKEERGGENQRGGRAKMGA